MNNEIEIRVKVYQKLEEEYKEFMDNLRALEPRQIFDKSYEKVIKEELVTMFFSESIEFDSSDMLALYKSNNPLEELYQGWMKFDGGIHTVLEDSVNNTIKNLKTEQKNKIPNMER